MMFLFVCVLIAGLSPLVVLPISLVYNSPLLRIKHQYGICTEPGCWRRGEYEVTACFYPGNYDWESPDEILCYDHITHSGFCRGCGSFWGGIESFDFIHPGWCDNCWYEIRANEDDWDHAEYDEDNDYWYPDYGNDPIDWDPDPVYPDDDIPF